MSNGGKRIHYTTLERSSSGDLMRLQAFAAANAGQVMRALYNDRRWTYTFPGVHVPITASATPLSAQVLGGLMVRCDLATSLLVDPGVALMLVPGGTPDDSPLMIVDDPGVSATGVLTFTANAGAGVRIDYVECQPVETVLEQATRDIFDVPTQTFNPTLVDKVKAYRLTYRIRTGVPGGGSPGPAAGWLPLAVIAVQVGATGFTQCDFWDVRPLVDDLAANFSEPSVRPDGSNAGQIGASMHKQTLTFDDTGSGWFIKGQAVSALGGYLAGGTIMRSTASSLAQFGVNVFPNGGDVFIGGLAIGIAENREVGFSLTEGVAYLVASFPDGLPRWVRYTQAAAIGAGGRVPHGPRGLIYVSNKRPDSFGSYLGVGSPPTPHAVSGFTAPIPTSTCLSAIHIDNSPQFARGLANMEGVVFERVGSSTPINTVTALPSAGPLQFDLVDTNTLFPPNIAWLDVNWSAIVDLGAGAQAIVALIVARTAVNVDEYYQENVRIYAPSATDLGIGGRLRIPWPASQYQIGGIRSIKLFIVGQVGVTQFKTAASLFINGWGFQ